MRILGISSATKILGAALIDDDRLLAEYLLTGEKSKAEDLITFIDEVLKKSGFAVEDIEAVAVTQGPGSYGGLRGGVQTAKSLTQILKVPVVGISTLEAIAYNLVAIEGTILAMSDASRDDHNLALFAASSGRIRRLTEDMTMNAKDINKLISRIEGEIYLTGIVPEISGKAKIVPSLPLPINVARLGALKIKEGEVDDYRTLMPYYLQKLGIKEWKS